MRAERILRVLLLIAVGFLTGARHGDAAGLTVTLSVDNLYPVPGGSSHFVITGPPGAQFALWRSPNAVELVSAAWGTVFVDPTNQTTVGQGTLPPSGIKVITLSVPPDPNLADTLWYFQAFARLGTGKGVSRGLAQRVVASPPAGARKPEALAVRPDGTRAFVVNEADGTVQVLDAVNDTLLEEIPVAIPLAGKALPIQAAIDPEGRHLFVINPQMDRISVVHTATGSVAAQLPVPRSCRGVAFDFGGGSKRIYVTNDRNNTVLKFTEAPAGTFTLTDTLALQGKGPGAIAVLPTGFLMVGHRATHELEVVNPTVAGGATVARTSLKGVPTDIVISGTKALVPTFVIPDLDNVGDGDNVVLSVDLSTFQVVVPNGLANLGTDYWDAATNATLLAVVGTGSGSVTLANASTLALLERLDLVPGGPTGNPYQAAFVPLAAPAPKLYVLDHFRETVRPVDLTSGPPFALHPEIALARSGQPRVPRVDLSPLEDGEWFFSSVEYFNGTAASPNRVTCNTCHPHTFASGVNHPNTPNRKQAQPMFDVGNTGPWLWQGGQPDLLAKTQGLFIKHGTSGGTLNQEAVQLLLDFQINGTTVPASPFLEAGGLSPAAQNGKLIFEGKANCASCHAEPLFIPLPPNPPTIALGVGVGLAPDNVPSLRGLWSSAPYLWNGVAPTLRDVIVNNPANKHGTTSTLTQTEIDDLVEFLKSL